MVWVRSEYAGELAVLAAWVAALLPWNIMYAPEIEGLEGSVLYIRWPFLQVRYVFGIPIAQGITIDLPAGALDLVTGTVTLAYELWIVGAVIVALATLLSLSMYVVDGLDERSIPADHLRTLGGLLAAGAIVVAGLTVVLEVSTESIWLGGTLLVTAVGLVWLNQTAPEPLPGVSSDPSDEGDPIETRKADIETRKADSGEETISGEDSETVSATDGGPSTTSSTASITTGTGILVGIATAALCSCAVFVATTLTAISWPAGWFEGVGLSIPTVVNQVLVLALVAVMLGGVLYLTAELLEREQPVFSVRVMGGLLGLGSVVLIAATIIFAQRGVFSGIPIPLGMIVFVPLAWILLTVDLA